VPNPQPTPPASNLDTEHDDEEKKQREETKGRKNQEKYRLLFLRPPARSTPGIRPHLSIRWSQPADPSVDPSRASVCRGFDLVVASSREEEEMNGAGAGHQQQQQRLRQQQQQALLMQQALQQQQQQQYQSGVLAAAAAAAMTQVVLPDPLFLICCFGCALGGSNARRSASEPKRLFLALHIFLRLPACLFG
jgi:hypothetical protein